MRFIGSSRRANAMANAISRRAAIGAFMSLMSPTSLCVISTSLVGGPSKADINTDLGAIDGSLSTCGGLKSCVSSYDDRPSHFYDPWALTETPEVARNRLIEACKKLGAVEVKEIKDSPGTDYVRASFGSGRDLLERDEVEFLVVSDRDRRIELRSSSAREGFIWEAGRQESLLEEIRALVGYQKLDVLRNRRRRLIFIESPWDTFGPDPPIGSMESLVGKKLRDFDWED